MQNIKALKKRRKTIEKYDKVIQTEFSEGSKAVQALKLKFQQLSFNKILQSARP